MFFFKYSYSNMHLCPFIKIKFNLYEAKRLTASTLLHRQVLFIELGTVQTGTGKVDPARKFKCTTVALAKFTKWNNCFHLQGPARTMQSFTIVYKYSFFSGNPVPSTLYFLIYQEFLFRKFVSKEFFKCVGEYLNNLK